MEVVYQCLELINGRSLEGKVSPETNGHSQYIDISVNISIGLNWRLFVYGLRFKGRLYIF